MTKRPEIEEFQTVIIRGGTSRGPVLLGKGLPVEEAERDRLLLSLVGDGKTLVNGLGGATPTTGKVVLIYESASDDADLEYQVGNIVIGHNAIDWAGTCGNMTATVPIFAYEEKLLPAESFAGKLRLRNRSTGRIVETTLGDLSGHVRGREIAIKTSYVDPAGSVLGSALPTGRPLDVISVAGRSFESTLVDITHPYLFLRYEDVVGDLPAIDGKVLALIEEIRASVCIRLGLVSEPSKAMTVSPTLPRLVLLHGGSGNPNEIRVTAVSMGEVISTVPVTAAICLAGAMTIPGTLPQKLAGRASPGGDVVVTAAGASLAAHVEVDPSGALRSVSVDRTARSIMRGTAWV